MATGSTSVNQKQSYVWIHFIKSEDKKKATCKLCSKELSFCGGTTNMRQHLASKHSLKDARKRGRKKQQTLASSSRIEMATGDKQSTGCGTASTSGPSDVWVDFIKSEDKKKATCKICSKQLTYCGGTTNLRRHLASKHTIKRGKTRQETLVSLPNPRPFSVSVPIPRPFSEVRSKKISEQIAIMTALDLRPIRTVEGEGLRGLIGFLEPCYKMPSRKHIAQIIHQKHQLAREKLRTTIAEEADKVAMTTDVWTSCATEAYITVTVHYISPSWNPRLFVLETTAFPDRHTGSAIAEKLMQIADKYALKAKVAVVVHDQASNMAASRDILSEDEGWESIPCFAHCLQLSVKAGLGIIAIDRLLAAARKVVGHFAHSVVATEELKKKQVQMNVTEKKLVQDVPTRWYTSYYMLVRLLEMRSPVSAVLSDETVTKRSDQHLDLKSDQWDLAEKLVEVLQPFELATTFFSNEENSSVSAVFPVLHGLLESLKPLADDHGTICQFKQAVGSQIKRLWSLDLPDVSSCTLLATAVDPRFKQLKFLTNEDVSTVKEELLRQAEKYYTEEAEPSVKKRKTGLDVLLGPDPNSSIDTPNDELDTYFSEAPSLRKESPLKWWKDNHQRFPCLGRVARSLLHIPATSTPPEHIFTTAGLTVTKLRSCLKPKNVDALVFLNKYLQCMDSAS